MAFLIHSVEGGYIPSWEYHAAGAITPKIGLALTVTSGSLAITGATAAPKYISMVERDEALTAGDVIPVITVSEDIIFETTFSAAATAVKVGDKVTISADGLQVTATTTSGVAEVVHMDGKAVGDKVRVKFKRGESASQSQGS